MSDVYQDCGEYTQQQLDSRVCKSVMQLQVTAFAGPRSRVTRLHP
jgi:hypothetical protein